MPPRPRPASALRGGAWEGRDRWGLQLGPRIWFCTGPYCTARARRCPCKLSGTFQVAISVSPEPWVPAPQRFSPAGPAAREAPAPPETPVSCPVLEPQPAPAPAEVSASLPALTRVLPNSATCTRTVQRHFFQLPAHQCKTCCPFSGAHLEMLLSFPNNNKTKPKCRLQARARTALGLAGLSSFEPGLLKPGLRGATRSSELCSDEAAAAPPHLAGEVHEHTLRVTFVVARNLFFYLCSDQHLLQFNDTFNSLTRPETITRGVFFSKHKFYHYRENQSSTLHLKGRIALPLRNGLSKTRFPRLGCKVPP